jgi:hypothetical protein
MIIIHANTNAIINNNYVKLQCFYFAIKNFPGHVIEFFRNLKTIWECPIKRFVSHGVGYTAGIHNAVWEPHVAHASYL